MTKLTFFIRLFIILVIVIRIELISQPIKTSHVKAELISEVETIHSGEPFWVATKLEMEESWYTYWRNPGDAGLATSIKWELPDGFQAGEINWTYPEKFISGETTNYGYKDELFLLTKITPSENLSAGDSIIIKARVSWLECKDICIPGKAVLSLLLMVDDNVPTVNEEYKQAFSETHKHLPLSFSEWNFKGELKSNKVVIYIIPPDWYTIQVEEIVYFPYEGGIYKNIEPQTFSDTESGYRLEVELETIRIKDPERIIGVLVNENGWLANGEGKALQVDIQLN